MPSADRPLWHSGIDPVDGKWLAAVPLMPDELLSSWLVRSALAQGCDPMTLTGCLWPRFRPWTIDFDRSIQNAYLSHLAYHAGIPVDALRRATLVQVAERLDLDIAKRTTTPWIMAIGARNRKRRIGFQFCPACLAADKTPYYRVQWRLAWHTVCLRHDILLSCQCPNCGSPVQPHRLEAEASDAVYCHRCSFDLRKAPHTPALSSALAFQREADLTVMRGRGTFGSQVSAAHEWFSMARFMVSMIRKAASRRLDTLNRMLVALGVDIRRLKVPSTGLPLELLPPNERAEVLSAVWALIASGSNAFAQAAIEAGVTLRSLCERGIHCPSSLLADAWNAIPDGVPCRRKSPEVSTFRPQSKEAVMRQWARLQRKWTAEDS